MALPDRIVWADSTGLNPPTVQALTDHNDLDRQIVDTLHAVGIRAIAAVSVNLLGKDYGSVFTTTVQKFQENAD